MRSSLLCALLSAVAASAQDMFAGSMRQDDATGFIPVDDQVVENHPVAAQMFEKVSFINAISSAMDKREDPVPEDGEPDPDRPVVTVQDVYVLQCSDAGFRGTCLAFGSKPGSCGELCGDRSMCRFADTDGLF